MAFFEKRINLISEENEISLVDAWLHFTVSIQAQASEYPVEPRDTLLVHLL